MRSTVKICLTGGPSAGKTTVLDIIRREFKSHAVVIPEAASILYQGGFPRSETPEGIRCAQRAIYYAQIQMEQLFANEYADETVIFCDRGTLDHPAYWPDQGESFFESVDTTAAKEAERYDLVIHLQTALETHGYDTSNPVRKETPGEALALDRKILSSWAIHPQRIVIPSRISFHDKITTVFDQINDYLEGTAYEKAFARRDSKSFESIPSMGSQESLASLGTFLH